ncbi:hypothetical protein HGM15179_016645 [Zosterops borbonicus]|uniref:Uncharacterized protein n=1 Tax=Zosterops borbonicus TaxID=364589 RepID=A0A8K1G2F1_9PASS|nr:hypothetical protein HGM15179_016645 [Zosterops borbonicus]
MDQHQFSAFCLGPLPSSAQKLHPELLALTVFLNSQDAPPASAALPQCDVQPLAGRTAGSRAAPVPGAQDPWKAVSFHGVGKLCREGPQRLVKLFTLKPLHPEGDWGLNRFPREVVRAPRLPEFKEHLDNILRHMVTLLGMSYGVPGVEI